LSNVIVFSLEPDYRWMQNMEKQSHALVGLSAWQRCKVRRPKTFNSLCHYQKAPY